MLKDLLLTKDQRPTTIDDCVQLIEDEVGAKGGLSGMAIKGAYAVVKRIKPGFIKEAVDHLLNDFVAQLEPFWAEWEKAGGDLAPFFEARSSKIANALLGITDGKAERAKNQTLKKAYEKLRPTAEKQVEAAVPGIARVLKKRAPAAGMKKAGGA